MTQTPQARTVTRARLHHCQTLIQLQSLQLADLCRTYRLSVLTRSHRRPSRAPAEAHLQESSHLLIGIINQIYSLTGGLSDAFEPQRTQLIRAAGDLSEIRRLEPISQVGDDLYLLCETLESVGSILGWLEAIERRFDADGAAALVYGSREAVLADFNEVLAVAFAMLGGGRPGSLEPSYVKLTLAYGERLLGNAEHVSESSHQDDRLFRCHARIGHSLMSAAMDAAPDEDYKMARAKVVECQKLVEAHLPATNSQ